MLKLLHLFFELTLFTSDCLGAKHTLVQLSNNKTPNPQELPDFWDATHPSFYNYMEQSLYGLRGIITDSITGMPLKAKVEIAVSKGKKQYDKRQTKKTKDWNREKARYFRRSS